MPQEPIENQSHAVSAAFQQAQNVWTANTDPRDGDEDDAERQASAVVGMRFAVRGLPLP